jgi:transketolase
LVGDTALSYSDDVQKRFTAYGWATKAIDGHDPQQINAALSFAVRSKKPTLIACHTIIGLGAPTKAGTAATHGSALGAKEAAGAKEALGWHAPPFTVPDELLTRWREAGNRGAGARRAWLKRLAHSNMRSEFERAMAGKLPDNWHEAVAALKQEFLETRPKIATRQSSQKALEALVPATPELIGGSADLTGSNLTLVKGMGSVSAGNFTGRYIHYGVREHGMAAAANGMALHGGIIPYTGTFFVFTDYMRPAIRIGAITRAHVIHVLTHDSIGLGEDGPTHQPIEHLASLRAMPHLHVYRPGDAIEVAECWELAIRRTDGPSLLVLTRQGLPTMRSDATDNWCARGGYVLAEADGPRAATLIATGSEVSIAMDARAALAGEGISVAVVSLPCWELFEVQDEAYRAGVLGVAPRIGIEAACGFGWERWLGTDGVFIGMNDFGASAPYEVLYKHFGITPEAIAAAVRKKLG